MLPLGFIPRVPRMQGERMPLGAGSLRRKKEEQVSRAVASGNLDAGQTETRPSRVTFAPRRSAKMCY